MSLTREEREAAARARLAGLAAKFIERTAGELAALREALARLSAGDAHALAEIRHLAHRMSGTGATLGFDTLSDCGSRIEQIADAQAPAEMPDAAAMLLLGTAVDALDVEIGRLQKS